MPGIDTDWKSFYTLLYVYCGSVREYRVKSDRSSLCTSFTLSNHQGANKKVSNYCLIELWVKFIQIWRLVSKLSTDLVLSLLPTLPTNVKPEQIFVLEEIRQQFNYTDVSLAWGAETFGYVPACK